MKGTPGLSRTNSLSQTTSSAGIAGCGFTGLPGKMDDFNNYTLEVFAYEEVHKYQKTQPISAD